MEFFGLIFESRRIHKRQAICLPFVSIYYCKVQLVMLKFVDFDNGLVVSSPFLILNDAVAVY